MKCDEIEERFKNILNEKYPELKFGCKFFHVGKEGIPHYRIFCKASTEFYYNSGYCVKYIKQEMRTISKILGIHNESNIFFIFKN